MKNSGGTLAWGFTNMIEYKESIFKSGKQVIFCKIEDLLKEYYHEDDMLSIREHLEPNGKNWIIHCPFCKSEGHTKHKLYIDEDCSRGFCFVCGRIYINIDDTVNVDVNMDDYLNFQKEFTPIELPCDGERWSLGLYYSEFDPFSEKGVKYLTNRNPFLSDLWKDLGIKFFNDNVVLPFKDPNGNLIYYQIRFIDAGKNDIRYFFPPIKYKPPYILQGEEADPNKIIIVEGIFDALAAFIQSGGKYVIIAVMGSKISDYQLDYIRHWYSPKKILIWMDEFKISRGIMSRLKTTFDYSLISIIPSNGPDPEEVMMDRFKKGKPIIWIKEDYGEGTLNPKIPNFSEL